MFKKIIYFSMVLTSLVFADHTGIGITAELDNVISDINSQVELIPAEIREIALESLKQSDARLHAVIARLDAVCGRWIQTNGQDCGNVCRGVGMNNVPSPEGALCVSGERRVRTARTKINYNQGTWGNECDAGTGQCVTSSNGAFCYSPGQKHDNDKTDRTVGCYCIR